MGCEPWLLPLPPPGEGVSGLHLVSLAHNSVVTNTSTGIVTAESGRCVYRLPVCREVTSWSPENAQHQRTSGQVSRLPALSGSSACLASLPSYSVVASELPSAPQGSKGKGGARPRSLLFFRGSSLPPCLPPRIPGLQPAQGLRKKSIYLRRGGWLAA